MIVYLAVGNSSDPMRPIGSEIHDPVEFPVLPSIEDDDAGFRNDYQEMEAIFEASRAICRLNTVGDCNCNFAGCEAKASYYCITCLTGDKYCDNHAKIHSKSTGCLMADSLGRMLPCDDDQKVLLIDDGGWTYSCHKSYVGFLNEGYFPNTITRPTIAFSKRVLKLARILFVAASLSVEKIAEVLISGMPTEPPKDIYKPLLNTLRKYMIAEHLAHHGISYELFLKSGIKVTRCDSCAPTETYKGPMFMMMDGNFSLKRYNSQGDSGEFGKLEDGFFIKPQEFHEPERIRACHTFESGSSLKKSDPRCDVSGLFGSVCSHGCPVKFLDIAKGEKLIYAKSVLARLKIEYPNAKLIVGYDIACMLTKHLSKNPGVSPYLCFTPVMHSYAHSPVCQAETGPQLTPGLGFEHGEQTEQLWSQLNGMASHTRVMSAANRIDALSHRLEYICRRKNAVLIDNLRKKISQHIDLINHVLESDYVTIDYATMVQKMEEERQTLLQKVSQSSDSRESIMQNILGMAKFILFIQSKVRDRMISRNSVMNWIEKTKDKLDDAISDYNTRFPGDEAVTKSEVFEALRGQVLGNNDAHKSFWRLIEAICIKELEVQRICINLRNDIQTSELTDPHHIELILRRNFQRSKALEQAQEVLLQIQACQRLHPFMNQVKGKLGW